jgi:hypothetical protein
MSSMVEVDRGPLRAEMKGVVADEVDEGGGTVEQDAFEREAKSGD